MSDSTTPAVKSPYPLPDWPGEDRDEAERMRQHRKDMMAKKRDDDDVAPQTEYHARDCGQQIDKKRQPYAQLAGDCLGQKNRSADTDRDRYQQGDPVG